MKPNKSNKPIFRIVTSSALFDGHDAAINVFRRLFQAAGLEVIHLGHNRSVNQLVQTVIQEDVDAVCVSSYQGAHMEFFTYLRDLLNKKGASNVKIFGGGGGTILPSEIEALHKYGITRLYHAEDGKKMGLRGIVQDAISKMQKNGETEKYYLNIIKELQQNKPLKDCELAKVITLIEQKLYPEINKEILNLISKNASPKPLVIGFTGPGGSGKSSLIDELILRYLYYVPKGRIGVLAFDPTKKQTGGALLGDRIRMNSIYNDRVFLRSLATKGSENEVSPVVEEALNAMKMADFDLIILETTGIGQGNSKIVDLADISIYVMTAEYGSSMQLEKIDMIDYADLIVVNKFDKLGSQAALEDVRYAYTISHPKKKSDAELPVIGTIASEFNNEGVTKLFDKIVQLVSGKGLKISRESSETKESSTNDDTNIIPLERTFYLSEIVSTIRNYKNETKTLADRATQLYKANDSEFANEDKIRQLLEQFHQKKQEYAQEEFSYQIRGKTITRQLFSKSLSNSFIPKIATPTFRDWGDIVTFMRNENFAGYYPYTAGVFPLKYQEEDPKRQFAGEGSAARTNKRFHFLSRNDDAKRLSTAFDPVTLYGEDPNQNPDVYGNIGNSGVSIATLDNMKTMYAGFDLTSPSTSVSLTINGPAPMILAMFFNTAIDFEVKKRTGKNSDKVSADEYNKIKSEVLHVVRGTVQADILKEEQAQNECIFSSKFALKMMGDIQDYFIKNKVKNFYSASISGYHIAEAGANPISQLAFTLANGFTMVEYYLARGMHIDDFAPSLSFFFCIGLDPEYTVIGRVARRIWSITLKEKYGANERSCKLKYHVQTSGRSLHAQEMAFNDIRTTLQALLAIQDNCNSLHTNAYDEAMTTPTEESLRRAIAIQLILTKEFGLTKCENPIQGSYFIEQLTDIVEDAVLSEFESLSRRGGVLGAMEKQYQRHRIQTESMKYESMKATGELPIVGVNTFVEEHVETNYEDVKVVRATEDEKQAQIAHVKDFIQRAGPKNQEALDKLRHVVMTGGNIFEELMETVKYCSLGQISHLLYSCGGEYRRSM